MNNEDRYWELYNSAVSRYLDKTDWDVAEWLDEEEILEYATLHKNIHGYCMFCGDICEEDCIVKHINPK